MDACETKKEVKILTHGGMINLIFKVIIAKALIITNANVIVGKKIKAINILKL